MPMTTHTMPIVIRSEDDGWRALSGMLSGEFTAEDYPEIDCQSWPNFVVDTEVGHCPPLRQ